MSVEQQYKIKRLVMVGLFIFLAIFIAYKGMKAREAKENSVHTTK